MPVDERELKSMLAGEDCKIMAGGTDLLVRIRSGVISPDRVVSLARMKGMDEILDLGEEVSIGSRVTMSELLDCELIAASCPILPMVVREIGSPQIRNRATLAGNLVNASPAGDSILALYLSNATVVISGAKEERREKVSSFIKGPGRTTLSRDEYVGAILIEKTPGYFPQFYKVGQRSAMAIAVASVGSLISGPEIRMAFGSVAPTVAVPEKACEYFEKAGEEFDDREFARLAMLAISPIDDVRASAWYRSTVIRNLVQRTLNVWRKKG